MAEMCRTSVPHQSPVAWQRQENECAYLHDSLPDIQLHLGMSNKASLMSSTHLEVARSRCMFSAMVSVAAQGEGSPRRDSPRQDGPYRPGYELVAERILELIAESGMRPGDRMPTENELAAQLGTSRTVVREAVKILSALGRISAQKGRGLYVADDAGDAGLDGLGRLLPADRPRPRLHAVRVPPGPGGRGRPARRDPGHPGRTAHHRGRGRPVPGGPRDRRGRSCSTAATTTSTSASPRPRTTPSSSPRSARPAGCSTSPASSACTARSAATRAEAIDEHTAIYRAIRDGDPDAAAPAAAVHIDNTLEDYRREIQRRLFG